MQTVPVSVWEQMGVVVLYTFLLIVFGGLLIRYFAQTIRKIEEQHTQVVRGISDQYVAAIRTYDTRSQEQSVALARIVTQLEGMAGAIDRVDESVRTLQAQLVPQVDDGGLRSAERVPRTRRGR